jgi:predicted acyltransferase
MTIMGISMFIALRKFNFEASAPLIRKILKRTILLYLVGLGIAWFSLTCRNFNSAALTELPYFQRLGMSMWNFAEIRILGVIPRLAICYGIGALIIITVKHKFIPWLIAVLLIGYSILLILGNGYEYNTTNILSIVDYKILGEAHMYKDNGIEPEGILSTIPAIAHVLLGFYIGKIMMETRDIHQKIERLFIIGAILTFAGFLLNYGLPINKKIWSPSFVLVTSGLGSTLLALLIWIIDVREKKQWSRFFEAFGVNPLFMYTFAAVLSIILGNISVSFNEGTTSLKNWIYQGLLQPILGDYPASLAFALLFVGFNWIFGYYLYKKKIYIKL